MQYHLQFYSPVWCWPPDWYTYAHMAILLGKTTGVISSDLGGQEKLPSQSVHWFEKCSLQHAQMLKLQLVVYCIAARTRQAAVTLTVCRQSFIAYMIGGCHHCFWIERGMYHMIMQQSELRITFRAVSIVLHCSERMLWSPNVYILITFLGVWNATLFTLQIYCLHPVSHTWLLLPCHLA
jgi:hypothetical protein